MPTYLQSIKKVNLETLANALPIPIIFSMIVRESMGHFYQVMTS
jgi:hypothetical protein